MKKFIVLSIVLVLLASAVSAQVPDGFKTGAWGRAVFAPLIGRLPVDQKAYNIAFPELSPGVDSDNKAKDSATLFTGTGVTWGNGTSMGLWFSFDSAAVGMKVALKADSSATGGTAGLDEENYIYVKPLSNDLLTIKVGAYNVDDLRGKIGGDWQDNGLISFHPNSGNGEDAIFNRFAARADNPGAIVYSKPVDPLFIGLHWNAKGLFTDGDKAGATYDSDKKKWVYPDPLHSDMFGDRPGGSDVDTAEKVWSNIQGGVGYTIENAGLARLGFFGAYKTSPYIQVAFNFTAVEGLNLDAGVKVHIPYTNPDQKKADTTNNAHSLALGAKYTSGALGIAGRFDVGILGGYKKTGGWDGKKEGIETHDGLTVGFNLEPWYDIGLFKVGATFGLKITGAKTVPDGDKTKEADKGVDAGYVDIGFGLFASKDWGNGNFTTGVALGLPRSYTDGDAAKMVLVDGKNASPDYTTISIPVILTYSF